MLDGKKAFNDHWSTQNLFRIFVSYFSWSFIIRKDIFTIQTKMFKLKF